jgi:hypothetical protein
MKPAALQTAAALAMLGGIATARAEDPLARLRACSSLEGAERLSCLDKLSRAVGPQVRSAQGDWVISQTTSPVDYAPIATATTLSREVAGGLAIQLAIRCRGGRTELVIAGPAISGRSADYLISYRVNVGRLEQIAAQAPAFGTGVAIKGDPIALLRSLPDRGELAVHLSPRAGTAHDAVFSLAGLEIVRAKMEAVCKWPHAAAGADHSS